jgi:type II secretory ATPase GspE/PulE/Tfp pilus assembly ATPase PilB-like protein
VDAKGNPIEIPICKKCKGRGYSGRVGIFELLTMSNELRSVIAKHAKDPSVIRQHAKKLGHLSFQDEGILAVATGLTSLQELQRIAQGK